MKRSGFTMIELIFVIVILGILAAVAIPKLAATRDDAKMSRATTDISTVVSDFGTYYTAKSNFKSTTNVNDITNVKLTTTTDGHTTGVWALNYSLDGGTTNCIKYDTTADGNMTVADATVSADTSALCTSVKSAVSNLKKTHVFGGTGVVY
jgi:prepilin-type N-terminal cleavage/methylation domain-containing protein